MIEEQTNELEQVIALAAKLSPLQRVRLVEQVMASLKTDLQERDKQPKRSLYGLWSDVSVSEEDIDEARREMWGSFPREDI